MHTISLLKSWLERNAVIGDDTRQKALLRVVEALLDGGKLARIAWVVLARGERYTPMSA